MKNWGFAVVFGLVVLGVTYGTYEELWGRLPIGASTIAPEVDRLYYIIAAVTTGTFWLVELLLVWFCIVYRRRPGVKPQYTHGSKTAEIIWTVIPAAILVALAIGQMPAWAKAKQQFPKAGAPDSDPDPRTNTKQPPIVIESLAQQFSWNFRYPRHANAEHASLKYYDIATEEWSALDENGYHGDVFSGTLFAPIHRKVLITLTSADVIHSLFLPPFRVKQDAVPGMYVKVWFQPSRFFVVKVNESVAEPKDIPADRMFKNRGGQTCIWVESEEEYTKWLDDQHVAFAGFKDVRLKDQLAREEENMWREKEKQSPLPPLVSGQYIEEQPNQKQVGVLYRGQVLRGQEATAAQYALGIFEIACAELCGAEHYNMRTRMWVGTQAMYRAWVENQGGNSDPKDLFKRRWLNKKPAWE